MAASVEWGGGANNAVFYGRFCAAAACSMPQARLVAPF
jgi:hypothetical protein